MFSSLFAFVACEWRQRSMNNSSITQKKILSFIFCLCVEISFKLLFQGSFEAIFMVFIIDIMDDILEYFIGKHINCANSIFYYNEPSPPFMCRLWTEQNSELSEGVEEGNWSAMWGRFYDSLKINIFPCFPSRHLCILLRNFTLDGDINANICIIRKK